MTEKIEQVKEKVEGVVKDNVSQKLALVYGIGMLTWTAFNQMNSLYWSFFLTDICGLEPTVMATVKSVSGMLAWIMIIVAAVVVEKVWLRWGQYRSWLLIAPAAAFVSLGMTWVNPSGIVGDGGVVAWMIVFYVIGSFASNFFMIAATSLVPAISKTENDRTLLSQRKAQGNMLVKVCFAMLSLPAILMLNSVIYGVSYDAGKSAGPAGYIILILLLGVLMIAMYYVLFKSIDGMDPTQKYCEERAEAKKAGKPLPPEPVGSAKVSFAEMIKCWITNVPALVGLLAEIFRFIAQMTIQGMSIYMFAYVYGDVTMSAVMLTACNVVGLFATFVGEPISKRFGIRVCYLTGIVVAGLSMIACYFVAAQGMMVFIVCICACYFGMNIMNGSMMGMQSNAIAYGEWRDGKTARAFIMSTFQWCPQIANAAAGALTGFGLAAIGYVAGMEPSIEMAQGFINIICLIPAAGFTIAGLMFFFLYPLGQKKMAQIALEIEARKQK